MRHKIIFFLPLFFLLASFVMADDFQSVTSEALDKTQPQPSIIIIDIDELEEITSLDPRDKTLQRFASIVEENYIRLANLKNTYAKSKKEPELVFFKYTVTDDIDLFKLASRFNIIYDTIVTLNEIPSIKEPIKGKTLIIPTVPGLFISDTSKLSIQILVRNRANLDLQNTNVCYNYRGSNFVFLTNGKFNSTERAYFLDASLGLPIDKGLAYVSSSFGRRKNPISGEWKNHNGVDFAANEGTPVKAVKNGTVSVCNKNDPTFGNYIVIRHDTGNMTSVYAHLSKIAVSLNDEVKTGDVIGFVGHTGMATGPHLHFEIRVGGVAEDPAKMLKIK